MQVLNDFSKVIRAETITMATTMATTSTIIDGTYTHTHTQTLIDTHTHTHTLLSVSKLCSESIANITPINDLNHKNNNNTL